MHCATCSSDKAAAGIQGTYVSITDKSKALYTAETLTSLPSQCNTFSISKGLGILSRNFQVNILKKFCIIYIVQKTPSLNLSLLI
jgi:hypothetical protein